MASVPASSFRNHIEHLGWCVVGRQELQVQGLITEHDQQRVLMTTRVRLPPPLGLRDPLVKQGTAGVAQR